MKLLYISIYCSCKLMASFCVQLTVFLKSINNLFIGMNLIIKQHAIVGVNFSLWDKTLIIHHLFAYHPAQDDL